MRFLSSATLRCLAVSIFTWPNLACTAMTGSVSPSQATAAPALAFRDCAECPEMVIIPEGAFLMGSAESETPRDSDEGPQRFVNIRSFAMGRYEVTFEEYDACVAARGCSQGPADNGWGRGQRPVINVSWEDAQDYARWLSARTGQHYRLPSEAEWEYAARAGATTIFATGAVITPSQAQYDWSSTYVGSPTAPAPGRTAPVGSFPANAFSLYDVHGNTLEWVEDCYADSYAGAPSDGSAVRLEACPLHVLRGGSWSYPPQYLRIANRFRNLPVVRLELRGFRLARTL